MCLSILGHVVEHGFKDWGIMNQLARLLLAGCILNVSLTARGPLSIGLTPFSWLSEQDTRLRRGSLTLFHCLSCHNSLACDALRSKVHKLCHRAGDAATLWQVERVCHETFGFLWLCLYKINSPALIYGK